MAQLIDPARVTWKLGSYGVAAAKDLTDPTLWARTQEYRRLVAGRLAPIDKRDLKGRLPAGEYHLSRKMDGELAVLVFSGGETLLVNPGGTVRLGLPLLAEAQKQLSRAHVKSALIAGELYYRHPNGSRPRVYDVSHAARQPSGQNELDNLCFAAFDIIDLDVFAFDLHASIQLVKARTAAAYRDSGQPGIFAMDAHGRPFAAGCNDRAARPPDALSTADPNRATVSARSKAECGSIGGGIQQRL